MKLKGKKIVILVEHHYQDLEVWVPYYRLTEEGAKVILAGTGSSQMYSGKYGYPAYVHTSIKTLNPKQYDALIIPGGWAPDFLRRHESVLRFVRQMNRLNKVIAAICHAGWVLASAKVLQGRTVTAFSAIRDDVIHAGAKFIDKAVVKDRNLITSRTPEDLPAFCRTIIQSLRK
jgi:protease I